MPSALADPPAARAAEHPPSPSPVDGTGASNGHPAGAPATEWRSCANCGAQMQAGQGWCLQCGAAAPGSLAAGTPVWRSGAAVLGAVTILVLGAAAAVYGALNRSQPKPRPLTAAVTRPAGAATPPTSGVPATGATGGAKAAPGATGQPLLGLSKTKPPKIPLAAATPGAAVVPATSSPPASSAPASSAPAKAPPPATKTVTSPSSSTPAGEGGTEQILLDTNAAATYDPYGYQPSTFGDPSLAIDGDTSTAWTAQVNPAVAPRMAAGLALDLNSVQRVAAIVVVTSTPGMKVQVYGAKAATLPSSITDPAWVQLSPSMTVKSHSTRIKLLHSGATYRFVVLWISRAPASAVGTPAAPGHVSVNEVELFPPAS